MKKQKSKTKWFWSSIPDAFPRAYYSVVVDHEMLENFVFDTGLHPFGNADKAQHETKNTEEP
jgi:hypothetical protein